MPTEKLLFIDTNIWLDFYRAQNDAGLKLLKHVEALRDRLIVTYQLEVEFKKNRQQVLIDSWANLKPPSDLGVPNIVADAQTSQMLKRHMREAKKRVEKLKKLVMRTMASPARYDHVYQVVQRIFHRDDDLVLSREKGLRRTIRNKALRRFLQGYPPRKRSDISMGDAFNWEWMVHCAAERKAELVIISRDSDFGVMIGNKWYPNDHLQQEFKERVSKRRKAVLFRRLTDALKYLNVAVSKKEVAAEQEWLRDDFDDSSLVDRWRALVARTGRKRSKPNEGSLLLPAPELADEGGTVRFEE